MKHFFLIILSIILLSACATTTNKKQNDYTSNIEQKKYSKNIITIDSTLDSTLFVINDNIFLRASISIKFPNQNHSVSANIEIAGIDSILIKITAFLGISVGQLYANKNEFLMNNNLESITYTGTPTEENIMKTALIPLSFSDLVSILKSIPPQNISNYNYIDNFNLFEYKYTNKTEHIFINDNSISKLIRMDKYGNEIFYVNYNDYAIINSKKIAKKISIRFPQQNGNIEISYSDIKSKDLPTSPMKIVKPKSYKLQNIE